MSAWSRLKPHVHFFCCANVETVHSAMGRELFAPTPIPNAQRVMRRFVSPVFMDVGISAASCEIAEDKNDETKQRCGCFG